MKAEQDKKISFKVRYVGTGKQNSKNTNKIYAAKESEFSLDFLINKCKTQLKENQFTLQLADINTDLMEPQFFQSVLQKARKGEQLIFVCKSIANGQKGPETKGQMETQQKSKETKKVQAQIRVQEPPKQEASGLKTKQSAAKQASPVKQKPNSAQKEELMRSIKMQSNQKALNLQESNDKKEEASLQQSKLNISLQVQPQVSNRIEEFGKVNALNNNKPKQQGFLKLSNDKSTKEKEQNNKQAEKIIELFRKSNDETQLKNHIVNLLKKYNKKPEDRSFIAKNIKCHQCGKADFKGPVYQCLICPDKIYFCSQCELKQQLDSHPCRAHPMAKIKYASQFIKQKNVKIVDCSDIPLPQSDDQHEKPSQGAVKPSKQSQMNGKSKEKVEVRGKDVKVTVQQKLSLQNGRKGLSGVQKQKKRGQLKQFFNATNQEVEKYMKGKYEYLNYSEIIMSLSDGED